MRRLVIVLALLLPLAACDEDTDPIVVGSIQGVYNAVSASGEFIPSGSVTIPGVIFEGPASGNAGAEFDVTYELLQATISLSEGNRYVFTGAVRMTETNQRFPTFTEAAAETGSYSARNNTITFKPDPSSDEFLAETGTHSGRTLTVEIQDPAFGDPITLELRR